MTIVALPESKCMDCGETFRYVQNNSTIKPARCPRCQKLKEFQTRKDHNQKLLSQASFYKAEKNIHFKMKPTAAKKEKPKNGLKTGFDKTRMKSKSSAMKYADSMFSRYIRLKHSFEASGETVCRCYTCGAIKSIKNAECGHWQRRGYKTTRFHEDNARPQCTKCNAYLSGEPEKFEINLIKEIGEERVFHLKRLAQEQGEDNAIFYNEMAGLYRYKYQKICKERGIKNPWGKK